MHERTGIRLPLAGCICSREWTFGECYCDELCAACRNVCDGTGSPSCREYARRRRLMRAHLEVALLGYVRAPGFVAVVEVGLPVCAYDVSHAVLRELGDSEGFPFLEAIDDLTRNERLSSFFIES